MAAMNREVAMINAASGDAVPEREPWTYRVPTSLVLLDDDGSAALPLSAPST